MIPVRDLREAHEKLHPWIVRTPVVQSFWLSHELEADVFLKLEHLQITGSFKPRGAFVKLSSLTEEQKKKGIIAMSAGNHAQAVAYVCQKMGISATIIMPYGTPQTKVEQTRLFGANVEFYGANLAESSIYAWEKSKETGQQVIPPYDDWDIIKGQGTLGLELMEDVPDLDAIIVPVGGGGLCSGVSIAVKALNPRVDIIGVQTHYSCEMVEALFPKRLLPVETIAPATMAEGIAVKAVGRITQRVLSENLQDMIVVTEEQIEQATVDLLLRQKCMVEGAGAAGVAAALAHKDRFKGKRLAVILCGGNIDSSLLQTLLSRHDVKNNIIKPLAISLPDDLDMVRTILNTLVSQRVGLVKVEKRTEISDHPRRLAMNLLLRFESSDHVLAVCKMLGTLSGVHLTEGNL